MRFQVPQFIETETKIVGPFTLKQFLYIAAGAIIIFLLRYVFTTLTYWIMASLPFAGIVFALAFYKIDDIPLPNYLMSAVSFSLGSKKYIFKQDDNSSADDFELPNTKYNKK